LEKKSLFVPRCNLIWWGDMRERDHLEDQGVDGGNIDVDIQAVGWVGLD